MIVDGVIKVKSDHSKTLTFKLCSQLYRYNYFEEGLGNIVYKFQGLPTGENIITSAVLFKYEPEENKKTKTTLADLNLKLQESEEVLKIIAK